MNMIKRVSLMALLVVVASGSTVSQAQAQFYPRNDRYQRDDVRNELGNLLNDIKNQSDRFARELDRALDRSRLNNREREDRLNDLAKDLKDQAKRVRDRFNNRNLQRGDIQQLVDLGNRMDVAMRSTRQISNGDIRYEWAQLRNNLSQLSRNGYTYNRYYGR